MKVFEEVGEKYWVPFKFDRTLYEPGRMFDKKCQRMGAF